MRILVLSPTFLPVMGGAEIGIHELCRRLGKRHVVRVLTPRLPRDLTQAYGMEGGEFDTPGYEVTRYADRLNLKNAPGQGLLRGLIPPFSLSLARQALRQARSLQPDVVLTFYALPCGLAAARIRKKLRIPVVLSLIGRDVPGPAVPRFWGNYVRWSMDAADRTLFISEYCRQALGIVKGPAADVVPFGVDCERFAPGAAAGPLRERLGIPRDSKVLLALQRLDPWKQVEVLIRAQALLLQQIDAYLVIGGKGPELERLRGLARDLGIASRVLFAGYIPDKELPLYYALADVFACHSTYETFGLSLLQAMAAGTPVVSVRSTAIPELIHHGENGLLVEPGDAGAFAQSVQELLGDGDMQKRFAAESRRRALADYGWDSVARCYELALETCVAERAGEDPA
ncbi:MAG: glycosyltransferase [Acidobacteria bacterium]|jgi:glycosyltransferase involved in cell wall biosynthesis|nr:glycosyltransferase [Acidobacteriota bacterium]